jgi:hypothetical protein
MGAGNAWAMRTAASRGVGGAVGDAERVAPAHDARNAARMSAPCCVRTLTKASAVAAVVREHGCTVDASAALLTIFRAGHMRNTAKVVTVEINAMLEADHALAPLVDPLAL